MPTLPHAMTCLDLLIFIIHYVIGSRFVSLVFFKSTRSFSFILCFGTSALCPRSDPYFILILLHFVPFHVQSSRYLTALFCNLLDRLGYVFLPAMFFLNFLATINQFIHDHPKPIRDCELCLENRRNTNYHHDFRTSNTRLTSCVGYRRTMAVVDAEMRKMRTMSRCMGMMMNLRTMAQDGHRFL